MDKNICTHPENCVASKTNENINASKKHKSMGKAKTHFFMQKNAHSDALSNGVGQQGHTVFFLQKMHIVTPFSTK